MAISWGTKITLLYCGFVALIITLIVASSRQEFDLVAADYYKQEIGYQQRLDAANNSNQLSQPIAATIKEGRVIVLFPPEFAGETFTANVHFYAPAAASQDRTFSLPVSDGTLSIEREKLAAAGYTVKVSWNAGGRDYYQEIPLNLQAQP